MKKIAFCVASLLACICSFAGDKDSTKNKLSDEQKEKIAAVSAIFKTLDSAEKTIQYKTGSLALNNGVAHLTIPTGFKFVDAIQSQYILERIWRNPPDNKVLGMIVSDSFHLNNLDADWAFVLTYEAMGYVKDDDADKIKYDELLADLKKSAEEANVERKKLGYDEMHLVGWAAAPYYDKQNKVLHWAKEFRGNDEGEAADNTLNYEIRVLGRKGVLSMNAVATMAQLPEVKNKIPQVLHMAQFDKGYKYEEFDSGVDNVAAWTIGGLVAGKLLAKAGILVYLLKFWKILALGIAGGFAAIKRFFSGRKKEDELVPEEALPAPDNTNGLS
ncbi:MAG TPA: DUF2167 domain-containing protein [Chitinophagaceae bacterium]|nr:DUF2167 domain-containing protein [Chitinophagaceae bacterium]